jgi:hypothetical protein
VKAVVEAIKTRLASVGVTKLKIVVSFLQVGAASFLVQLTVQGVTKDMGLSSRLT